MFVIITDTHTIFFVRRPILVNLTNSGLILKLEIQSNELIAVAQVSGICLINYNTRKDTKFMLI